MRATPLLLVLTMLLAAPPAAAAHPYVQSEEYLVLGGCCAFGAEVDDTSVRIVVLDAQGAATRLGASVAVHDDNHGAIGAFVLCGDSGAQPLPAGTQHLHLTFLGAADNLARCGAASGLVPLAGRVEARMNGA